MEEVLAQFKKWSSHVRVEKANHGEFDLLAYFEDGQPDAYYYCLKQEGHHVIYHRFTKEDYKGFGFEPEHVERISRKLVHAGSILDIYSDTMLLPNGKTEEWDFVAHRKGAAAVLPVTEDGKIILVHQYRPALERMTWEVPAGSRDSVEESTLVCATRELEEETGYTGGEISFLISLKTTVAFCNEFIDVYVATGLKPGKQHLDEAERIEVKAWEMKDLLEEIYAGRIQDSKTVSAILAYQVKVLMQ
jgi:ADP-ribose pyrophosphatase